MLSFDLNHSGRSLFPRLLIGFAVGWSLLGDAFADPVSLDRAQRAAENWLAQQTGTSYQARGAVDAAGISVASPSSGYYIVNLEPNGWVIVAGDDAAYPIVGYSPEGDVSQYGQPPAFAAWMAGVGAQISEVAAQGRGGLVSAGQDGTETAAKIQSAWASLENPGALHGSESAVSTSSVGPLLTTTWSQGTYYNRQCPADTSGPDGRALVGCVATAMGQIMRHHGYPSSGTGSHSYNHRTYGTLSANFGATNYAWSSMPSSGQLTSHNSAVATLLSHAGIAVDMNYGPSGSGAYPSAVGRAFRDYFGYDADDSVSRSSYASSSWLQKIRDDLDANLPVFYVGYGSGGHAFVCDGYSSGNNYFHFNWGWGGYADGNFYLDDLTPGSANFNSSQAAVFGIEPGDDGGGDEDLSEVLEYSYSAGMYDAYASYYGGLALGTGGNSTYKYYTYLYASYAYTASYNAYLQTPSGSQVEQYAYDAFLYSYYRYLYAVYDYYYGGYGYSVLAYDLNGDIRRAQLTFVAVGADLQKAYQASIYDAYSSYYGGLALGTGGNPTYKYYTYLYASYAYNACYDAYVQTPSGSRAEQYAYNAFLYSYYRYLYAIYDYYYGGYGFTVLGYDLNGDISRTQLIFVVGLGG